MSGLCRGFQTPVAGKCEWLADRRTWWFSARRSLGRSQQTTGTYLFTFLTHTTMQCSLPSINYHRSLRHLAIILCVIFSFLMSVNGLTYNCNGAVAIMLRGLMSVCRCILPAAIQSMRSLSLCMYAATVCHKTAVTCINTAPLSYMSADRP